MNVDPRSNSVNLTPAQSRAARGLLRWSQAELGASAYLSKGTIRDFEAGLRVPSINNLAAIKRALESAGVVFIAENGFGIGVRLRHAHEHLARAGGDWPRDDWVVGRLGAEGWPEHDDVRAFRGRKATGASFGAGRGVRAGENETITSGQVKAARKLLGWTQVDLACRLRVSETSVTRLERGIRRLPPADACELCRVFEAAGVEFTRDAPGATRKAVGDAIQAADRAAGAGGLPPGLAHVAIDGAD